ncbi:TRAP-type C4-dicarboxylate transport system, small permease component [Cohaesibacter marisflavi]|uniref:TRAP transporter small permease protein n=1 Tax=Cohaesibacter marisflavi TaxID=655353 RepID=A0A1I5F1R4_9HYPH|nr:TRAP transporter small permease [Cohaesibacter marisflavi]SFO17623.1 TRAP-type C4-dicarboxylate transport system, small permease component [Cohaesibacter marisflavi]
MFSLRRLVDAIFKVLSGFAIVLFTLLFVVVMTQIILRYLFNSPLVWSDEFAQYAFIWLCFIGWLMASRNNQHIVITTVIGRLSESNRKIMLFFIEIAAIIFSCVMLYEGYAITLRNVTVSTASLFFPFAVVYAIVPVFAAVAILVSLVKILDLFVPEAAQEASENGEARS